MISWAELINALFSLGVSEAHTFGSSRRKVSMDMRVASGQSIAQALDLSAAGLYLYSNTFCLRRLHTASECSEWTRAELAESTFGPAASRRSRSERNRRRTNYYSSAYARAKPLGKGRRSAS